VGGDGVEGGEDACVALVGYSALTPHQVPHREYAQASPPPSALSGRDILTLPLSRQGLKPSRLIQLDRHVILEGYKAPGSRQGLSEERYPGDLLIVECVLGVLLLLRRFCVFCCKCKL
jgi:hypothetical protein